MIAFEAAFKIVQDHTMDWGQEELPFQDSLGRILAEPIYADRDFPPFDRSTRDGIAISYSGMDKTQGAFRIQGIQPAGSPPVSLSSESDCVEIMTGAVVPENADTVVMYEHLEINGESAKVVQAIEQGQNIHNKGNDLRKGAIVLDRGIEIGPSAIGVMASVGKTTVSVKTMPKVAVVSTGNELVAVDHLPKPHQIRRSNSHTLAAALQAKGISARLFHFLDDREAIKQGLQEVLHSFDVVMLSGGVSKGKYDFLPEVLEELEVVKLFHRVMQRPGKPFWFGKHTPNNTTVFAFPGNPGSTFANYHVYFLPWLAMSYGKQGHWPSVFLESSFENTTPLTRFIRATTYLKDGRLYAKLVNINGSGDLTSLVETNGFLVLEPNKRYEGGAMVPLVPVQKII